MKKTLLYFLNLSILYYCNSSVVHAEKYVYLPNILQGQGNESVGGLVVDPDELSQIPAWDAPKSRNLYSASPVKDLRYNQNGELMFPAAGRQSMNDCTAWASAYHLKTYLEAVDNQWIPDRPSRIFSPSFVYNQINNGRDSGSSVANALKLMNEKGAATLETMPYTTNYTAKPNTSAYSEAKKFRISKYYSVGTLAEIKQALQMGHPLLIGIVTDSTFNSGRYQIYNKAMRDSARDRLGASHGRHAMVIVGFDDSRKALLFLNSWGTNWGENGYVWVSYDVFNRIGYNQNGDNFLEVALVAIDEKSNIENVAPNNKDVSLNGKTWFNGIDIEGNKTWGWKGNIVVSSNTKALISKIEWGLPEKLNVNEDTDNQYEISGITYEQGKKNVQAIVSFNDGTSKTVSFLFDFKEVKRGALKFVQTDKYYGKINKQNQWDWSIRIDGSLTDLNDIEKVIYHLHPTFKNPDVEITGTPENGFVYKTRGWGTFKVGASVYFKDGTEETLSLMLKFTDKEKSSLVLKNTSIPLENRNGTMYYNWTAFVEGSEDTLSQISKVQYILHPTFKRNIIDVEEGKDFGFPFSATGWGTFELKAVVHFSNGTMQELKRDLVFSK